MPSIHRTALFTAIIPLLGSGLCGQNDYDLDKVTAGTLGAALTLQVRNAPVNKLMVVMPSYSAGPTPIAMFDPADPRSVEVGLDLASAWWFLLTSPTGTASFGINVPGSAIFHGHVLHWQTATFPGSPRLVDQISNKVITQVGLANTSQNAPNNLITGRALAASFFNRVRNAGAGDLVVAGGGSGTITNATGLQSSELWDFRTLRSVAGPNMTVARAAHTACVLNNGRVLLCGGTDSVGVVLNTSELYDPATNTFTPTGNMLSPRTLHAAVTLADGRVMIAGGTSTLSDVVAAITATKNTTEIYNPATGTWSAGPNIGGSRLAPALTLLNTGLVLISGGVEVGFLFGLPLSAVSTVNCQRYNPGTNSWGAAAAMQSGRAGHHTNQVTLNDNRVLMTGGVFVPNLAGAATATSTANAEYYNPAANTWTSANMATARSLHSATLLADGRVVVCGGAQGTLTAPTPINGVELFTPSSNTWSTLPSLQNARASHVGGLLPDGMVVLLGGQGASGSTASCETIHF